MPLSDLSTSSFDRPLLSLDGLSGLILFLRSSILLRLGCVWLPVPLRLTANLFGSFEFERCPSHCSTEIGSCEYLQHLAKLIAALDWYFFAPIIFFWKCRRMQDKTRHLLKQSTSPTPLPRLQHSIPQSQQIRVHNGEQEALEALELAIPLETLPRRVITRGARVSQSGREKLV